MNPQVWLDAATQIFFSLSVAFGGLIVFSSYNPSESVILLSAKHNLYDFSQEICLLVTHVLLFGRPTYNWDLYNVVFLPSFSFYLTLYNRR